MKNLYEIISHISYYLEKIIGSQEFILLISSIAILIKSFIFFVLIAKVLKSKKITKPIFLLFLVIVGSIIADSAWILASINKLSLFKIKYIYLHFWSRISWGFYIIYYQALALFIEDLSKKNNKIWYHQKILLTISSMLSLFFIGLAFYQFDCYNPSMRPQIEINILTFSTIYMTLILMPISLFSTIRKMKAKNTPKILQRQLKIFIQLIVTPILLADLIQTYPFTFITSALANSYAAVGISSILITYGIFHCMRKIMNMRFLNLENHVQAPGQIKNLHFVEDFKKILDKFSHVSTISELEGITQEFFSDALYIPKNRTRLYIKTLNKSGENQDDYNSKNFDELLIDNFISVYDSKTNVGKFLIKNKVIITDEIEFSNFYDEIEERYKVLQLMEKISADIFIPIFENGSNQENFSTIKVSGYIIVEKNARINNENKNAHFYTNVERDQMIVYSNYLGNIIKLLQTRSLNQIIKQEKTLTEELERKNQAINQYRESLEYFLRNNNSLNFTSKKFGLIFYKNRKFEFENSTAQELISVKLNLHDGHPITKKLKYIATKAEEYKSQQSCVITNQKDEKIIACAIPNTEKNNVVIILSYQEISDVLNKQTDLLKNQENRGFILYLETTKAGKLVNDFIPGSSDKLLEFKINFLKTALNQKNILVNSCDQDMPQVIDIINKISNREIMHTINLDKEHAGPEILIKLFGINPISEPNYKDRMPILETLDKSGILFIKNIHFLDLETQKYLYEFIKYGYFNVFKGEKKTFANVKIICSCDIDLQIAVQEGSFSKELFEEFNNSQITIPTIKAFSQNEIEALINDLIDQAIKTDELQYILELTESEKRKLINNCPNNFYELKNKINNILMKKSKKTDIYLETNIKDKHELNFNIKLNSQIKGLKSNSIVANIDDIFDLNDQQIIEALKLGKNALKDIKIMSMLWTKFKNQNKIASLLCVNRSSINRRCKEYNLLD